MKKLSVLWILMWFFLLGNLGSFIYVICEKDKDRVWACVPLIGFFVIGGCIVGLLLTAQRDEKQIGKDREW